MFIKEEVLAKRLSQNPEHLMDSDIVFPCLIGFEKYRHIRVKFLFVVNILVFLDVHLEKYTLECSTHLSQVHFNLYQVNYVTLFGERSLKTRCRSCFLEVVCWTYDTS